MHGGKKRADKINIAVSAFIAAEWITIAILLILGENSVAMHWWSYLLSFSIVLVFALIALLHWTDVKNANVIKGLEEKIHTLEIERTKYVLKSENEKVLPKPFTWPGQASNQNPNEGICTGFADPTQMPTDEIPKIPGVPDSESPPIELFVEFYNAGTRAGSGRERFYETYAPKRFADVNFLDKILGVEAPPEFALRDDGDFFAVLIPGQFDDYWIVPRFALNLNSERYDYGSMGEVFECLGYEPGKSYTALSLKKPASFRKEGNGWILVEQGVINVASDF